MAARESQGFQIALIIFVMLTVLLSMTTFVFFRNYQSEQLKYKEAQTAASAANLKANDLQAERDQYLLHIGVQASEKKDAVEDIWKKDMDTAAPLLGANANLPDDQRTYKKVLDMLQGVVRAQTAANQKLAEDLRTAKTNYETKTTQYEENKKTLEAENKKNADDYLAERKRVDDLNQELNDSKTQMAAEMAKNEKTASGDKAQLQGQIAKLDESLKKMQTQMQFKSDDLNKLSGKFDVNAQPNGRIVWTNEREHLVYINLGSDDRLRKRVTFSVYDPSTTDVSALKPKTDDSTSSKAADKSVSEAKSKGSIEVINITGPHMAVCRILSSQNTAPMLPEDLIFTPLWRAGQSEHFALVGTMDIDGDGVGDREQIHNLIRQNGGVIDAETDEKGAAMGAITYETRYLVKGKNDQSDSKHSGYNKLTDDATKLGVQTVDLAKFLDMMGYVPQATEDKAAVANNIQPPIAGQPNNNFRPRTPPATSANTTSAY